jgi:hypothetical protein
MRHRTPGFASVRWVNFGTSPYRNTGASALRWWALGVVSVLVFASPSGAETRTRLTPKSETADAPPITKAGANRVGMTKQVLTPTVRSKRAIGALLQSKQQVAVAFDIELGGRAFGRIRGLASADGYSADLRYFAAGDDGVVSADPFSVRVRDSRVQVTLPPTLVESEGVDGYVTYLDEVAYGAGGFASEATVSGLSLEVFDLLSSAGTWGQVSGSKGQKLKVVVPREGFSVLNKKSFGDASITLTVERNALTFINVRIAPTKEGKADGARVLILKGTLKSSAEELSFDAPRGAFVTASKLFDLLPVPENAGEV